MNDRIVTLLGALLALFLATVLLLPSPRPSPHEQVSIPTTADRGDQGLYGLDQWLRAAGVGTVSLRRRYDSLMTDPRLPERGNLLIVSVPERGAARNHERDQLRAWLARGNSLLVLAAAQDTPPWSVHDRDGSLFALIQDLGWDLDWNQPDNEDGDTDTDTDDGGDADSEAAVQNGQADAGDDDSDTGQVDGDDADETVDADQPPAPVALHPTLTHPLVRGVTALEVMVNPGDTGEGHWQVAARGRLALPLLQRADNDQPALWEFRVGEQGRVWFSLYADLFGNRSLGRADNARFAANLTQAGLAPGGQVVFDDMHQGLSDLYDPQAFFGDPRLSHTLWFLFGFWLLYVLGRSNRLAPVAARERPAHAVDFVRAVGGLLARRLRPAAVAPELLQHFYNEIRARHGQPLTGEPAFELLATHARVERADLERLRVVHQRAVAGRRIDLPDLTRLIANIRNRLL